MTSLPSARAQLIERRTYLRPVGDGFETPTQALDRVIGHQRYLWENAVDRPLNKREEFELSELRQMCLERKISHSGRVKWMGGTDVIKSRPSAGFNCAFTTVEIPADLVDTFWLLLQGCGVGFKPVPGLLTGFPSTLKNVTIIPSTRDDKGGEEHNSYHVDRETSTWIIKVGDSAKGWAKAVGRLLGDKPRVENLVIDLSALRPGGKRLRGYGWLSSGWEPLAKGFTKIIDILQREADQVLSAVDIGDIVNLLGTVLSSRRSAEIWVLDDFSPEIEDFINAKVDIWANDKGHRAMSNNTILFWSFPGRKRIEDLLSHILANGDPGFANAAEAKRRAPEFTGFNPCAEILLPSKGFCNLFQVVWHRFNGQFTSLLYAQYLAGRANYRQTCVSMKDGVLQLQWNDNQKLLRLCGVSPTGYVAWEGMNDPEMLIAARDVAIEGANSMADALGLQRPRRVTQVQPAGTVSKVMGLEGDEVHEGAHCALSRWIFNHVNFSIHDPLLPILRAANYEVRPNPGDKTGVLVKFPVEYPPSPLFTKVGDLEINLEPAVSQLERYRFLMKYYVQNNCSITISYDETEIPAMAEWFEKNWDDYVALSFLRRNDPTKTAEDLGHPYLPQECISKRQYDDYASTLLPVDLSQDEGTEMLGIEECANGVCPIR